MWLLLVAAGTGYLARCWHKSRKFKTGLGILKCNAALHASQESPSCTPRRGRSTTLGRRGLRKRSRSARGLGMKLLHGRKEGKLATTQSRDSDENLGSPDKVFDESLCGEEFAENINERFLSLTTVCAQDSLRETSSCMKKPSLSTVKIDAEEQDHFLFCGCELSIEKVSSKGSTSTRLDFAKKQLEGAALSSSNWLSSEKPTENASLLNACTGQLLHACPEILGVERRQESLPLKLKKSTEQAVHFFAKVASGFSLRTCSKWLNVSPSLKPCFVLNTGDAHVFKYLSYGKPCETLLEEKKREQRCAPYFVHSQHLKALLDPEFFDHCQRCGYLPFSLSSYNLEKAISYPTNFTGISMARNQRFAHVDKVLSGWTHSPEKASEPAKPINLFATSKSEGLHSKESCSHSSNEVSFVALGVAMGVLLVAIGRSSELKDLHKLLEKNNTLIEELRMQIGSRFELDPFKLPEVEKVPSGLTVANGTCSWKVHLHPDISSSHSAGEKGSLELFNASNNHVVTHEFLESHAHGFDDLEAELQAELQLIELNGCNPDLAGHEWEGTQRNQKGWQHEGDENGYIDKPEGDDDDGYVDIDNHDSIAIQDAGQVYESDFVVPPLELERRLWQVLEQRHEERICELENDLRVTQEKVTAKEMEAQWWKDRVWWLMETSPGGKSECEHPVCLNS